MKVVDMFAAQLPAFAIEYEAIGELVKDNQNGKIFRDRKDLSQLIFGILLEGVKSPTLKMYHENLAKGFSQERWETYWEAFFNQIV